MARLYCHLWVLERFGYVPEGQVFVATARWCPSESCLVCVGIVRSFWLLIGGGMLWPWNPSCPWWPWVWGYNDCWSWSVRVALPVLHHPHVVWMFRLVDRRFFFHGRFSFRVPRAYEFVIGVVALVGLSGGFVLGSRRNRRRYGVSCVLVCGVHR